MNEKFSLVIPTYNESGNIIDLCKRAADLLSAGGIDFEIIVVDDDSPDGTAEIVEKLCADNNAIKLLRRKNEKCLSTAVLAGWARATGDILGVIDGDMQHPPETLINLIKKLREENADIVIASRNIEGGGVSKWSVWRRSVSWFGTLASYLLLPDIFFKVRDPMSGYFVMRRDVIAGVDLKPMGYKILIEVFAKGRYKKVLEVPYVFQERQHRESKAGIRQYIISLTHFIRLSAQTWRTVKLTAVVLVFGLAIFFIANYLYSTVWR